MLVRKASIHNSGAAQRMLERDHVAISEIFVELNRQALCGGSTGAQLKLLDDLSSLSLTHFALEEAMMSAVEFPCLEAHRLRHRNLFEELRRAARNWTLKQRDAHPHFADRIWDAHVLHMRHDDLAFGHWCEGPGLAS